MGDLVISSGSEERGQEWIGHSGAKVWETQFCVHPLFSSEVVNFSDNKGAIYD